MICFHTQEMVKFSRYIVAKFFELLPKNPVLLAELVVWKSAGDCYEIVEGYGSLVLRYGIASLHYLLSWAPLIYYWTWQRMFRTFLWKTAVSCLGFLMSLVSAPWRAFGVPTRKSPKIVFIILIDVADKLFWCRRFLINEDWHVIVERFSSDKQREAVRDSANNRLKHFMVFAGPGAFIWSAPRPS